MSAQPTGNDALLGPDQGDMGLGLCLECVVQWKIQKAAGKRPTRTPNWAITLAPTMVPVVGGMMMPATVGLCLEHIATGQPASLVVANGRR